MKRSILFVALLTFVSCSEESNTITSNEGEVASSISVGSQSEAELQASLAEFQKEEEKRLAEERANSTTLEFDKLEHDFGNVKAGVNNSTYFKVTNTGDKPLIIEDVSASCGCTTPVKPEGPIAPGESDVIEVSFKSKPGQVNDINKTVTVTANTEKKVHMLKIHAFVEEL